MTGVGFGTDCAFAAIGLDRGGETHTDGIPIGCIEPEPAASQGHRSVAARCGSSQASNRPRSHTGPLQLRLRVGEKRSKVGLALRKHQLQLAYNQSVTFIIHYS